MSICELLEWFPEVLESSLQKEITCMAWKPIGGNILAVGCRYDCNQKIEYKSRYLFSFFFIM